jgi:predicted transcriptional regulator
MNQSQKIKLLQSSEIMRMDNGEPKLYAKAYSQGMMEVVRWPAGPLKVFLVLMHIAEPCTNIVELTPEVRQFIAEKTNMSTASVRNCLVKLGKLNAIERTKANREGQYVLNKDYTFQGKDWGQIKNINFIRTVDTTTGKVYNKVQFETQVSEEDGVPWPMKT